MTTDRGSLSLDQPDYWWYRARRDLLHEVFAPHLGRPERAIDVGSADGPSVDWMNHLAHRVTLDRNPRGLPHDTGVCGSATALPFPDGSFDVVAAFDVIEHCASETEVLTELSRVLAPGGRMLLSVPAYQWAWTQHDVNAGHYRRYTRARLRAAVQRAGLTVERSTYAFTAVFPLFLVERASRRVRSRRGKEVADQLAPVSGLQDRILVGLTRVDRRLLRRCNLPFGSSVMLAASKPTEASQS